MADDDRTLRTEYEGDRWESIEYEGTNVWTTRVIESLARYVPGGPVGAGYLAFGWLPVGLTAAYVLLRGREATTTFLIALLVATGLIASLPVLIYYYDERILPTFARQMTGRVDDVQRLSELAERYERTFARRYWIAVGPWTLLILTVFAFSTPTLESQGVGGVGDPVYWLLFAFFACGGLLTGLGFHGIVVTLGYIRAIVDELNLRIDPYHPDKLGGLSSVGYFAIRTTLLVSSGTLLLPLAFELAAGTPFQEPIYVAVVVYVAFIAVSFAYPTWLVNRAAHEVRVDRLEELGDRITDLQADLDRAEEPRVDGVAKQLELQRLQQLHDDYRTVRLYPMSPEILTQLLGSLLLPMSALSVELLSVLR